MLKYGSQNLNLSMPYFSYAPSGIAQDVQMRVHLPVAGHVDHGDSPPQFGGAVVPGLLVDILEVVLDLLPGSLKAGPVLVVGRRDLHQSREQQRVLCHPLHRYLGATEKRLYLCLKRIF